MRLVKNLLLYVFLLSAGTSMYAQDENKKNVFTGHAGISRTQHLHTMRALQLPVEMLS
jgi:hypothetical protein